jgi:hypothetical protein
MAVMTTEPAEAPERVLDPEAKTVVKRIVDDALAKAADDARRQAQARATAQRRADARARYRGD